MHVPIPIWKTAPFVRLLFPFVIGILLQWHLQLGLRHILLSMACFAVSYTAFRFLPLQLRYRLPWLNGLSLCLLLMAVAALVAHQKDIRHRQQWLGHRYHDSNYVMVRICEPLTEKPKSFKAEAQVLALVQGGLQVPATGRLLLYFAKDSQPPNLRYGDEVLLYRPLQRIQNRGNPGGFDYVRYAAFQQLFHQAYLRPQDYAVLPSHHANPFWQWIYDTKVAVLSSLRSNIANKEAQGIAEALLMGYKEDLDKDLVQAYSNTGVVHIIAISGLHVGLIYSLLWWWLGQVPLLKKTNWPRALLVIAGLWLFALLTGASASVLRSTVMFTLMVGGQQAGKQSSMYNALAASALLLLAYNPFWLWDVGFQLSYLAVLGIVAFQRPIYNMWHCRNKWVDKVWQLTAVSLSAQLLTFPICLYHFHQFPVLFLLANLVAVPLSSLVLYAELLLVALAWVPGIGPMLGLGIGWLLQALNWFIRWLDGLPVARWDALPATVATTCLLYMAILSLCGWLLQKAKAGLWWGLGALAGFAALQALGKWESYRQCKMVVYNVPQRRAIDWVRGNRYCFVGDSSLRTEGLLQNFHLKPSRIALQLTQPGDSLPGLQIKGPCFALGNKTVVLIDSNTIVEPATQKIKADVLILSGNPPVSIPQLTAVFDCTLYVFDSSNPLWKIKQWKTACEQLILRSHSVAEQGAFILDTEY
jgi:competence protein ComEC